MDAPKIPEESFAKINIGFVDCTIGTSCNESSSSYIGWDQNYSRQNVNSPWHIGGEYICIPVNSQKAFLYSASEQLLISPWSNLFY